MDKTQIFPNAVKGACPMRRFSAHLAALTAAALFVLVVPYSSAAARGAGEGLQVALSTALPSLFPFFVIGGLFLRSGAAAALGRVCAPLIRRAYGLPGIAAGPLILGLTGGYPLGAQATRDLFDSGALSQSEAERLLGFCNNTGPAFLVGVCGAGLCGSVRTGILLYLIHIAAALLTGLAIAGRGAASPKAGPRPQPRVLPLSQCLTQATEQAGRSCLKITAFIMLFSMLRRVLEAAGFFSFAQVACAPLLWFLGAPAEAAEPLATGLLEMTSGLVLLPESAGRGLLPAMSLLVGFGGLSVLCQTAAAVNGLSLRRLFYGKVLHGLIAAALTMLVQSALPAPAPVFAPLPATLPGRPAVGVLFCAISIAFITFSGKQRHNRL